MQRNVVRGVVSVRVSMARVRTDEDRQASPRSTRATPPALALDATSYQPFNATQPTFLELAWPSQSPNSPPSEGPQWPSHENKRYLTPLSKTQLRLPLSPLHSIPHHNNNHKNFSPSSINLRQHTPPTPNCRGGIPFLASVQAGFTPPDLWAVPATKVTKKTALQGPQLSTMHDGVAPPREDSQR